MTSFLCCTQVLCQARSWISAYSAISKGSSREIAPDGHDLDLLRFAVDQIAVFIVLASDLRRGGKEGIDRAVSAEFLRQTPLRLTNSLSCLVIPLASNPTSDGKVLIASMDPRAQEILVRKETICFLTEHAVHILSSKGQIMVEQLLAFDFNSLMSPQDFSSQTYQIISLITRLVISPRLRHGWSEACHTVSQVCEVQSEG